MPTLIPAGFRSHKQHLWFGGLTFPLCPVIIGSHQATPPNERLPRNQSTSPDSFYQTKAE
jgi:hypothetical protein